MQHGHRPASLWRSAVQATAHCLAGCAIGEILGMVIATALAWGNAASIALSIVLAFVFGYGLTLRPVLAAGVPLRRALGLTFASDTVSIGTMEAVDNGFVGDRPRAVRRRSAPAGPRATRRWFCRPQRVDRWALGTVSRNLRSPR